MAGGAWNTTIAAEVVSTAMGDTIGVHGAGALLKMSSQSGDNSMRWATITVIVIILIIVNRTLWKTIAHVGKGEL